jgi:hypothetical protein
MKLKVTKNTQSPNGDFTLTLTGEDGVRGTLELPVPAPEKDVFLYEVGQEFTLTAGPKPAKPVTPPVPPPAPPNPPVPSAPAPKPATQPVQEVK